MKYKLVDFLEWRDFTVNLYKTGNYRFESQEDGNSILVDKKTKEVVAYREYSKQKGTTESFVSQ